MPAAPPKSRKRMGRPPKPPQERRDHMVQVTLTKSEYEALLTYKDLVAQGSEAAAARAAIIAQLRSDNLLPSPV